MSQYGLRAFCLILGINHTKNGIHWNLFGFLTTGFPLGINAAVALLFFYSKLTPKLTVLNKHSINLVNI